MAKGANAVRFNIPAAPDIKVQNIVGFKGLHITDNPFNSNHQEALDMKNLWIDDGGVLSTRPRVELSKRIYAGVTLLTGDIWNAYRVNGKNYYHIGNKLIQDGASTWHTIQDSKSEGFVDGKYLYILDGKDYFRIDSDTDTKETVSNFAKIPTYYQGWGTGSNTNKPIYEDYNILTNKYRNSYFYTEQDSIDRNPLSVPYSPKLLELSLNATGEEELAYGQSVYGHNSFITVGESIYYINFSAASGGGQNIYLVKKTGRPVFKTFNSSTGLFEKKGVSEEKYLITNVPDATSFVGFNLCVLGDKIYLVFNGLDIYEFDLITETLNTIPVYTSTNSIHSLIVYNETLYGSYPKGLQRISDGATYEYTNGTEGLRNLFFIKDDTRNYIIGMNIYSTYFKYAVFDPESLEWLVGGIEFVDLHTVSQKITTNFTIQDGRLVAFLQSSSSQTLVIGGITLNELFFEGYGDYYNYSKFIGLSDNAITLNIGDNMLFLYPNENKYAYYDVVSNTSKTETLFVGTTPNLSGRCYVSSIYTGQPTFVVGNSSYIVKNITISFTEDNPIVLKYTSNDNTAPGDILDYVTYDSKEAILNYAIYPDNGWDSKFSIYYTEHVSDATVPEFNNIYERFSYMHHIVSDNIHYFSEVDDPTYYPTRNSNVFPKKITGLNTLTDDVLSINTEDMMWFATSYEKTINEYSAPFLALSYVEAGSREGHILNGNTNTTPISEIPIIINKTGVFGLQLTENVQSTERTAMLMSQRINKKFSQDITESALTLRGYNYMYIVIPGESITKVYSLDCRTTNWYYWEIPHKITSCWVRNNQIFAGTSTGVVIELTSQDRVDNKHTTYDDWIRPTEYEVVDWYWKKPNTTTR